MMGRAFGKCASSLINKETEMRRRPKITNGAVLWVGPSEVDGKVIVLLATCLVSPSDNTKTGPMVQLLIMLVDEPPHEAVKSGHDKSVCGDCPARGGPTWKNWCYVLVWQSILKIWKAFKRGAYPKGSVEDLIASRWSVRGGAYANHSSVPFEENEKIFSALRAAGKKWTLYEHDWRNCDQRLAKWAMASCETLSDAKEARRMGWRPYWACLPEDIRAAKEEALLECPFRLDDPTTPQCADCGLCNGKKEEDYRPGIFVPVHGANYKIENYNKMRESLRVI